MLYAKTSNNSAQLRHTYLRVLYPLLNHTQLRHPPFYKRDELLRLLECLSGVRSNHFQPVDQTTVRLVSRCATVPWLKPSPEEWGKPENPAHRALGMSLAQNGESSMSIVEVAAQKERPGIHITPRRMADGTNGGREQPANGLEIAGEA
jgi:hypothetical protein